MEGGAALLTEAEMAAREKGQGHGSLTTLATHFAGFQPSVLRPQGPQPLELAPSLPFLVFT